MAKQNFLQQNSNIILPLGVVAVLFFGGRSLLQKLGIIDTKEDAEAKKKAQALFSSSGPFNPNFYREYSGKQLLLTRSAADAYAQVLYNAHGFFNDDESKVYGIFQNLKTQSQASFLADIFQSKFSKSLIDYLAGFLDTDELGRVNDIVLSLPQRMP